MWNLVARRLFKYELNYTRHCHNFVVYHKVYNVTVHRVAKSDALQTKLVVSVYRVPQMQGVGRADDLLYFKCLADAVPCERLLYNPNVGAPVKPAGSNE